MDDTIGRPTNLAEVLEQVLADESLSSGQKKAVRTNFNTYARVRGETLENIPVDPAGHRAFIKIFHPVRAGFSKKHWQNVVSRVNFALYHTGITIMPGRSKTALSPEWQSLYDLLPPGQRFRAGLSRFMRFCSSQGISPNDVTDEVMTRFLEVNREESLAKKPEQQHRRTIILWNQAVEEIEGWPQIPLTVPNNKFTWTTPMDQFPKELTTAIDNFIATGANPDPFDEAGPRRPLAEETIRGRLYQLQCYCSSLVMTGNNPEDLRNLHVLVDPETVKRGLKYLYDHYQKKKSTYRICQLLRIIARDFLKCDESHVAELTRLCARLLPEAPGMTDKNRERLRQLDDPRNVRMLLDLPQRLLRKAIRQDQGRRLDAVLVQLAVAIEILLVAPLRRRNLANLSLDQHLQWSRSGRSGIVHLVIEAAEVKNRQALEFELPVETSGLLKIYIDEYRPRLTTPANRWLFPGKGNGPKVASVLGTQIIDVVFEETGLNVNPHLFRHIAAKLFLDHHPGQYEVIRRILGHQNMQTTVDFYAGAECVAAARHFDGAILNIRQNSRDALTEDPS